MQQEHVSHQSSHSLILKENKKTTLDLQSITGLFCPENLRSVWDSWDDPGRFPEQQNGPQLELLSLLDVSWLRNFGLRLHPKPACILLYVLERGAPKLL